MGEKNSLSGFWGSRVSRVAALFRSFGLVYVQVGELNMTRYRITLRLFAAFPSSLYMNLRGEEGIGATRNRRFCMLDSFILASKRPSCRLHPRIHIASLSSQLGREFTPAASPAQKAEQNLVTTDISLRKLLPTRCHILEDKVLLERYLLGHVSGLLKRCSLRSSALPTLLKSSLW